MPVMPRYNKKAEKIAWKVLGKPDNIAVKQTPRERELDNKLDYQVIVGGR